MSSFHDFIKVNKRLGVVLKDYNNLEKIFLYFAEPEASFLIYKKFCEDIFYFISTRERNNRIKKENDNNYEKEESFNEILTRKILEKDGPFSLLELIKNIKIIDYENCNLIFFHDFIRALKRTGIILEENEKMKIFEECDYYFNKNLHYENLINMLLNQFWSEEKNDLCEQIFFSLTNNGKQCISINYIEKIFRNILNTNYFIHFLDKYKLIYKNNSLEPISLKDFITLFKCFNFGQTKSDFLKELNLAVTQNINGEEIKTDKYTQLKRYFKDDMNKTNKNKKHQYSKSVNKVNIKDKNEINMENNLYKIITKIKNIFIQYGRLSLFNFIKQFKYYETNDGLVDRNNFRKVFNNFNINLMPEEIDFIFNELGVDHSKNYIYHEDFIKFLSVKSLNQKRDDAIKNIYDILLGKEGITNNDLNINYLKDVYNSKNNYFIKNEEDNYLEFIDCLEIFHFCYKGLKFENFSKKEFVEFYRLISFLVQEDNDFIFLITNEWRINRNDFDINYNNKKENKIINNKNEKDFLLDLKNELVKKGVKGLLILHYKFLTQCPNISKITQSDFINIMNLNQINFDLNEFKDIFNYFSINSNNKYLDYTQFIRFFKKELNETKLNIVEKIFLSLQYDYSNEDEDIPIEIIKNKYKAKNHPEVVSGIKTENEQIKEFKESFDINYDIFNSRQNLGNYEKLVDFDIFANFYEYVSFIYEGDDEFVNLLVSTWC